MAIDWTSGNSVGDPKLTTLYTLLVTQLKERDENIAKMDFTGDTNLLTGFIRANVSGGGLIERWNGSSWIDVLTDYTSHLTNTANPHGVDATDVGATDHTKGWDAASIIDKAITIAGPTNNDVLQYVSATNDWRDKNFTEAGIASQTDLDAHIDATGDVHDTLPSDIGALDKVLNLSDLDDAPTARGNLGLLSLATLGSINNGNWAGAVLTTGNGGTGSSSPSGARANLFAAINAANNDITSLTNCNSMGDGGVTTVGSTAGNTILRWGGSSRMEGNGSNFFPVSNRGINLGTPLLGINGINVTDINSRDLQLNLTTDSATDILFGTNGSTRIRYSHSANALQPQSAGNANLGSNTIPWNGISGNIFNYTGATAGVPGGALGTIAIQVAGVARHIAYYA